MKTKGQPNKFHGFHDQARSVAIGYLLTNLGSVNRNIAFYRACLVNSDINSYSPIPARRTARAKTQSCNFAKNQYFRYLREDNDNVLFLYSASIANISVRFTQKMRGKYKIFTNLRLFKFQLNHTTFLFYLHK